MKQKQTEQTIEVKALRRGAIRLRIIGVTPLFQNRMPEKVKQILMLGGQRKTAAERKEIKHHPFDEFRSSAEIVKDGPTALGLRTIAIKSAMCSAAIETEGVTKASVQRLMYLPGECAALYGTPQLRLDVVRCANIDRTPDVRSRAFLPVWGAEVDITYVMPQLNPTSVISLLCNAGILIGVGDYRQEKGKGNFGLFRVIGEGEQDDEWDMLVRYHGRKAQLAALESPEFANEETAELMALYSDEVSRRDSGSKNILTVKVGAGARNGKKTRGQEVTV